MKTNYGLLKYGGRRVAIFFGENGAESICAALVKVDFDLKWVLKSFIDQDWEQSEHDRVDALRCEKFKNNKLINS